MSGKSGRIFTQEELLRTSSDEEALAIHSSDSSAPNDNSFDPKHSHSNRPTLTGVESSDGDVETNRMLANVVANPSGGAKGITIALKQLDLAAKRQNFMKMQKRRNRTKAAIEDVTAMLTKLDANNHPSQLELQALRQLMVELLSQQTSLQADVEGKLQYQSELITDLLGTIEKLKEKYQQAEITLRKIAAVKKPLHEKEGYAACCHYCFASKHSSLACPQFEGLEAKKEELKREGRCFRCLENGHKKDECPHVTKNYCFKCKDAHHFTLCPRSSTKAAIQDKKDREELFKQQAKELSKEVKDSKAASEKP